MKNVFKRLTAVVGVAALSLSASMAQDSALVDALVKKGVLTNEEGQEIQTEEAKDWATSPAGKIQVDSFIKGIKIYGDVRYRYEVDDQRADTTVYTDRGLVNTQGSVIERNRDRNRVRLRLGAEFDFTDNFKANVRLATGSGGDSTNADLGNVSQGPGNAGAFNSNTPASNNSGYAIKLDIASLEYDKAFGADWLKFVVGKQLFGHNLVQGVTWDDDINPEGGFVKIGDFKCDDFTISATSGAYIYGDITDASFGSKTTGPTIDTGDDTWLLINQVNFGYKFNKDVDGRISPGFVTYTGTKLAAAAASAAGVNGGSLPVVGNAGTLNGFAYDVRDLNVAVVDFEFNHPLLWDWKQKLYGDYGVNVSGAERAKVISADYTYATGIQNLGAPAYGGNDKAFGNQFVVIGATQTHGKGKGGVLFDEQFIYQEEGSWDPNLSDSDWFGGSNLNGVGFGLKAAYNFTDFLTGSIRWRHATDIQHDLPYATTVGYSAGSVTTPIPAGSTNQAVQDQTDLVQLDLTWKF